MVEIGRRDFLKGSIAAGALALPFERPMAGEVATLPFANGERPLVAYPGKRPLLQTTARPPQLETPFQVFDEGVITPNDAFFVRYHLADIPTSIDPDLFRLEVSGHVDRPIFLSLRELKSLPVIDLVAVNQCSGNSRGFFLPRVAGGQLGNGAMGNARWTGVSLKSVLDKAGVKQGAVQVAFTGLDGPVLSETPRYAKALAIDHVEDGEVMLAWAMNGEELPWLNGYPLRLVVPGFYGTYWIKHLSSITVLDTPFDGFWMQKAYRIPDNECACVEPGAALGKTVPIHRLPVRSFITNLTDGATVRAGTVALRGIAFDGGSGITAVDISLDDGTTWSAARLGQNIGQYSFRSWSYEADLKSGSHLVRVRAKAGDGTTQPMEPRWNPAGYMRNVIETTRLEAL